MKTYHKIQSVFKRDPENKFKTFLMGEWSLPEFGYLQNNQWIGTEKVDGTNIRVKFDGERVHYGGRTDRAQIPKHLIVVLEKYFTPETLSGYKDFTLYGEGFGKKIQKVGSLYGETDFVLFDVVVNGLWLERESVDDIAKSLGIKSVPLVFEGTLLQAIKMVESGQYSLLGDLTSEGLILTPKGGFLDRQGNRIITKIKHKDFN